MPSRDVLPTVVRPQVQPSSPPAFDSEVSILPPSSAHSATEPSLRRCLLPTFFGDYLFWGQGKPPNSRRCRSWGQQIVGTGQNFRTRPGDRASARGQAMFPGDVPRPRWCVRSFSHLPRPHSTPKSRSSRRHRPPLLASHNFVVTSSLFGDRAKLSASAWGQGTMSPEALWTSVKTCFHFSRAGSESSNRK